MTPYLESFAGVAAGTATVSVIRRVVAPARRSSSAAYAQFDNHNADGSRATFPLEVEDGDTYGISAAFVRGPNFGVVQVSIDGRPLGAPFDGYAAAWPPRRPGRAGHARALGGQAHPHAHRDGQERGVDRLPGGAGPARRSTPRPRPQPTPTAVATAEVGGTVPATLALTLGAPPSFGAFQPGVAREYTASTTANVDLDRGRRGADGRPTPGTPRPTARARCAQPLRVGDRPERAGPSRSPTTRSDRVQAGDRGHRPAPHRHLRQDADVHALHDQPLRLRRF